MGNARKKLLFGIQIFPSKTCPKCNSPNINTWLHVLLKCNQHRIHAFRTKRHNKTIWEIRKLILSSLKSRCYILMNAGSFNNNPKKNTVPTGLLPCTCGSLRCHYNARLKPDILCIKRLPYQNTPPSTPTDHLTIQFIEFTYINDRFSQETIDNKILKYQPPIDKLRLHRWKVDPLIVITTGARGTTHASSMKQLITTFQLAENAVKNTFEAINTSTIQYARSILLHKK